MAIGPRVLQVALSLNPGGTERLIVELARRLHPEMPTQVCCLDEAGSWAPELLAENIEVHALNRQPGFRPGIGRAVARAARHHRASVIHAHQYSPFVYSSVARIWHPSLKIVFTEHGRLSNAPPSPKRRAANWWLSRGPQRVFAVSEDLKRHMVREGFSSTRVDVIRNGIDPGLLPGPDTRAVARAGLGVPSDAVVIGSIGRLDPVKDFGTLLRAIAALPVKPPVVGVIIGDGPERGSLEALSQELRLEARVRFLGHRDDARALLAGCDLYVNSSISEGVSLTILEAMAAGLPVLATRVGGTPEAVDDTCGVLVPSGDASAVARAIAQLIGDPGLRARLARAARTRVETHFTLDRMVQEYADVYQSLAAGRSRQGRGNQG